MLNHTIFSRLAVGLALLVVGCGDLSDEDPNKVCDAFGDPGCPCTEAGECTDQADGRYVCVENLCQAAPCPAGSVDCPCDAVGACGPGLVCGDDTRCAFDCEAGTAGCACSNGACADGAGDVPMACVDDVCQAHDCQPGDVGCVCGLGEACASGAVCDDGTCVADVGQTLDPPANPLCWTPCRGGDIERTGGPVQCDADGLIAGCIGDALCIDGTCIDPSAAVQPFAVQAFQACDLDRDCPETQNCIDGGCYSDCEVDGDCNAGRVCHRRACRAPCTTAGAATACAAGYACRAEDGVTGVCMPNAPVSVLGTSLRPPGVGYDSASAVVSPSRLVFTGQQQSDSFELTNTTEAPRTYKVFRTEHTIVRLNGTERVTADPLSWLEISSGDADGDAAANPLEITLEPGDTARVEISGAETQDFPRWRGVLSVTTAGATDLRVELAYLDSPAGRWSGNVYYLANFSTTNIGPWQTAVANGDDDGAADKIERVGNALIRRWWAFREGSLSRDEFIAVLTSTIDKTWDWPVSREACADDNYRCYPADNFDGFSIYTDDNDTSPVPSGVSQLDLAINVRPDGDPSRWVGRIDSSRALQYPGYPGLSLTFRGDPNDCHFLDSAAACITPISGFDAETIVGARYPTTSRDINCAAAGDTRFQQVEVPWLLTGFDRDTVALPDGSGARSRYECRDTHQPLGSDDALAALNLSFNSANPIPNGRPIHARLQLLDGALINGEQIFLLFNEQLPELVPGQGPTNAYGFVMLEREDANLEEEDFVGFEPPADPAPVVLPGPTCSAELLSQILSSEGAVTDARAALAAGTLAQPTAALIARGALRGVTRATPPLVIEPGDDEVVYYVCHDTGYIGDGGAARRVPCPPGSEVTFFAVKQGDEGEAAEFVTDCNDQDGVCNAGELCAADQQVFECDGGDDSEIGCRRVGGGCAIGASCGIKGSCLEQVERWTSEYVNLPPGDGDPDALTRENHWFRPSPEWTCESENAVSCDLNRLDLTDGKDFYRPSDVAPVFLPLEQAVDEAFRYKTRFQSRRSGTSVGFAPEVCTGANPYCYDPASIEQIRDRVDCVAHLYVTYFDGIDPAAPANPPIRPSMERFLTQNYGYRQVLEPGRQAPTIYLGFETLYAELLIMMGDESFTNALSSRFDLAGQRVATFRGQLFEPDGVELAGPVGYEMYNLYQATQYYQAALDRLYSQLDSLGISLDGDFAGVAFIDAATAVSWFSKLIRASSQKSRAWAKIAERYHGFERPIPAQRVIEKAYATTYMESIFFAQLQAQVLARVGGEQKAQVEQQIETAQLAYKDALLVMQNVRAGLADNVNIFGFTDTYVPFAALDPGEFSAFEVIMDRADEKVAIAAEKEAIALDDRRAFDVDAATFQAELTQIELDNQGQLAELCGFIEVVGEDGAVSVYPATAEFAYLDERARVLGDPCGLMGNGALADAFIEVEKASLSIREWQQRRANLLATADDEEARIGEQCDRIESFADWRVGKGDDIVHWTRVVQGLNTTNNILDRAIDRTAQLSDSFGCLVIVGVAAGSDCPGKIAGASLYSIAGGLIFVAQGALDIAVAAAETTLVSIEQDIAEREITEECDAARIDGRYVVRDLMRQVTELDLEGLQLAYDIKLTGNNIKQLRNMALCISATLQEQRQLTIDVEAARNDPNVRVYRNDAVRNADRTFSAAVREAYRATRMYEYYTNSTYEFRDQLPLVRMVVNGDHPLDAYLSDLSEAFFQWEERFGKPDLRVDVISVADDVFQVPRVVAGRSLDPAEVAAEFSARLASTPRDIRGAHLIDFRTRLDRFSPLTHNHKIRFIEVEYVGEDLGDELGRAYVRQKGDGVGFLSQPNGVRKAYSFPERTAVVDTYFNGERPLSDALGLLEGSTVDIYRNERLRDRPAHHSGWQLILNFEDEFVNQDIEPQRIEDVRIYIWYADFTDL